MVEESPLSHARFGASHRYIMVDAWHPGVMLAYVAFIVPIACTVPTVPLLVLSLLGGVVLLVQVEGGRGIRTVGAALVLGCAVMLLAPFFDVSGDRVLFAYFGRPYTFEALMRGALTGLLVAAMLVWFTCLFRIVGSDGILRVFGGLAPRVGMVTSLVMQMIPRLTRRAARVRSVRIGAGLVPAGSSMGGKLHEAAAVFATVASDSLERSVVCADAMESRGYGTGERTNSSLESFAPDERAFLIIVAVLAFMFIGVEVAHGLSGQQPLFFAALIFYGLLCFLPVLFNVMEDVRWRI